MSTTYRLHYFPKSGNSCKLALMLALCDQTFEPVWTDFGGGITRTPEWRRAVNVMAELPVLEIDGVAHTQTAPILLCLSERTGAWLGRVAAVPGWRTPYELLPGKRELEWVCASGDRIDDSSGSFRP